MLVYVSNMSLKVLGSEVYTLHRTVPTGYCYIHSQYRFGKAP